MEIHPDDIFQNNDENNCPIEKCELFELGCQSKISGAINRDLNMA